MTRDEVLEQAAVVFETDMTRAWGGAAAWLTTGTHIGELVAEVLRGMADDAALTSVATNVAAIRLVNEFEQTGDLTPDRAAALRRSLEAQP